MSRARVLARLVIAGTVISCSSPATVKNQLPAETPAWVGTFAYFADSVNSCTAGGLPDYPCTCRPVGHYEGTLTLTQKNDLPSGTIHFRECHPDSIGCGGEVSVGVIAVAGVTSELPSFCAVTCGDGGGRADDNSWLHTVKVVTDSVVTGRYIRHDGSPRGCGMDFGPFVLHRQG